MIDVISKMSSLQDKHGNAGETGSKDIGAEGVNTERRAGNLDAGCSAATGGRGGTRAGRSSSTGASGGGRAGDAASTGGTSLSHENGARALGTGGGLCGGRAVPAASAGLVGRVCFFVVGVQDPGELLGGVAHAVCAVLASGTVVGDAVAGGRACTADFTEKLANFSVAERALANAGQAVVHAAAELLVRAWGQRRGLGFPGGADGGTSLGRVAGGVGCAVGAGGADGLHAAGKVGEVGEGADAGTADGNKT